MRFRASPHSSGRRGRILFWLAIAALGVEAAGFWVRSSQLKVSTVAVPAQTSLPSTTVPPTSTLTPATDATVVAQSPP